MSKPSLRDAAYALLAYADDPNASVASQADRVLTEKLEALRVAVRDEATPLGLSVQCEESIADRSDFKRIKVIATKRNGTEKEIFDASGDLVVDLRQDNEFAPQEWNEDGSARPAKITKANMAVVIKCEFPRQ